MASVSPTGQHQVKAEEYSNLQEEKEQLKAEHEQEINRLKHAFATDEQSTKDRYERTLQNTKLKNYENLNAIKRASDRSEQELQNKATAHYNQAQEDLYRDTVQRDTSHKLMLSKVQNQNATELQNLSQQAALQQEFLKETTAGQTNAIVQDSQVKLGTLQEQKNAELARQQANSQMAKTQIQAKYEGDRNELQTRLVKEYSAVQNRVSEHLDHLRKTNAHRLGAYTERLNDPFYHIVRFDADISEKDDSVQIKVKVPPHERENVRLQVSVNSAKIVGIRSNSEEFESGPGRKVATSAQQSFSETVALPAAVDARSMRVEESGEFMIFTLDKLGPNKQKPMHKSTQHAADRTHAAEPDFPSSLPQATPQSHSAKSKTMS